MELLISKRKTEDILCEAMIDDISQQINRNIIKRISNGT